MPYLGIDFGTSNSVVANFQYGQAEVLPNREGQKWTPSVVTLRRDEPGDSGADDRDPHRPAVPASRSSQSASRQSSDQSRSRSAQSSVSATWARLVWA